MKKILAKTMFLFVLCAVCLFDFVACGNVKESVPWDNLGGGGIAEDVTQSSEESGKYLIGPPEKTEAVDPDKSSGNYYEIDLSNIVEVEGNYSFESKTLTILTSGTYSFTGTLNGSIVVSGSIGDVNLIFNDVTINSSSSQAILINKDKEKVKQITLNGTNSINMLSDLSDSSITAKNCKMVINGNGSLNINANGSSCSGIKAKYLTINGPTININATKNGIKSDFNLFVLNSNLNVTALCDGIKTDAEPESESEALKYSGGLEYGYIYISKSNIVINAGSSSDYTSGNHGISANNCLYIDNENYVIDITTNGGSPESVTERLSDLVGGKTLRVSGIEYNEVEYKATYEENYALIIIGGEFVLNSCSDAIASKGNLIIDNGKFTISSGDDGIHAEYLTKINGGDIEITKSYEGIEGACVEIYDGKISINALDDGINSANGDLKNYSFYILIAGGEVFVNAYGDGLDSNGTLKITGGTVIVEGPTSGADASLDADTGILTNGGNVFAIGSRGMIETPSTNSTQPFISLVTSSTMTKGCVIEILDSSENVLFSHTSSKQFQSLIVSLSQFEIGKSYIIKIGSSSYSVSISSIGTSVGGGGQSGMGPGFHNNPKGWWKFGWIEKLIKYWIFFINLC